MLENGLQELKDAEHGSVLYNRGDSCGATSIAEPAASEFPLFEGDFISLISHCSPP